MNKPGLGMKKSRAKWTRAYIHTYIQLFHQLIPPDLSFLTSIQINIESIPLIQK